MDSTPIYTELQQTLIDPDARNWDLSAPPDFAAMLTDQAQKPADDAKHTPLAATPVRSGGRRHRAED